MSTHSNILAWRIPWTEEPGRLQSMGLQRVGHDLVTEHTQHSGDDSKVNRTLRNNTPNFTMTLTHRPPPNSSKYTF